MVPAAVVAIDALPLTVNGKLDTRALPAPEYQDADQYRAPAHAVEEILSGIYAQVLGLERVGVDESFFELGGDSILAMQVVARARAAGLVCRPRDIFVEQTVARLAGVAEGAAGLVDEGSGTVVATPIMRWLASIDGPDRALQPDHGGAGPRGGDRGRRGGAVAGVTGSACHVAAAGRGRWRRGLVVAGARGRFGGCARSACTPSTCCPMRQSIAAGSRLNPAAGVMLSALWVASEGQLVVDRAPSGRRRGVVADSVGGPQHRLGPAPQRAAGGVAGAWDVVCPVGGAAGRARAPPGSRGAGARRGGGSRRRSAALPAVRPEVDTYVSAGELSVALGCRDHPDAAR